MVTVVLLVWLLSGLIEHRWWLQLACFGLSCYLMVELSNGNALLRVRSRMVTSSFIALSCAACPLFGSLPAALVTLFFIVALLLLFTTYRRPDAVGRIYYAFLFIGLASFPFPQALYYVPVLWLLMASQLQSLSLRGFFATLLGLLTPYWLGSVWCIYQSDFSLLWHHLAQLGQFAVPYQGLTLSIGLVAVFVLTVVLSLTGIVHLWLHSFEDKIRIRLLYGFFTTLQLLTALFLLVQPQHVEVLLPLLFVFSSPLIAHFFTFTHSRLTNILFFAVIALLTGITVLNLWKPSLSF